MNDTYRSDLDSEELGSCELGTKDYWISVYDRDIQNFKSHGDVGEVWFGEESALRVVRWITANVTDKSQKIVDLGCGNGMLLIELAREGFTNLTGIDYCQNAIDLAESIVSSQQLTDIHFKVADLTGQLTGLGGYDIAVDKGTYDAISLDPHDSATQRENYMCNVATLLKPGAIFVLTTCNWTESEIAQHFHQHFTLRQVLPTPRFQFGGKIGNLVSSLILQKK